MTSIAAEQTRELLKLLNEHAAQEFSKEDGVPPEESAKLRRALKYVQQDTVQTPEELLRGLEDHFLIVQGASSASESELELYHAALTVQVLGSILHSLLLEASQYIQEIDYWRKIEQRRANRLSFLVQSKAIETVKNFKDKLAKTDVPTEAKSLLRFSTWRQYMNQTLLITSLFPHLSQGRKDASRPVLAIAFSPYLLAAQEARLKRTHLQRRLDQTSLRIGHLAGTTRGLLLQMDALGPENLFQTLKDSVSSLEVVLLPDFPNGDVDFRTQTPTLESFTDCGLMSRKLLQDDFRAHAQQTKQILATNGMPSAWVRAWPKLVFYPIAATVGLRVLYNSRQTLIDYIRDAKETLQGFLRGWVLEPITSILDTVRHGSTENSLAIMGKASLDSDLASLERMVVDFGRDTNTASAEVLEELGRKVREGDLTLVLKEWEKDIKNPVKSAITGSLIRVLLIQVQKGKVDVDLAMSGIEKLLRSQQLTFAFIGVAPSLLVLYASFKCLQSTFSRLRGRGSKRHAKDQRRTLWAAVRDIDVVASNESNEATLGALLVQTQVLRDFVASGFFPRSDFLRDAFLQDVRRLEWAGDKEDRRLALDRFYRSWAGTLHIDSVA